jgi:ElaB/YqjD/DUF883 family membrane-anchored ribosome-binding protein
MFYGSPGGTIPGSLVHIEPDLVKRMATHNERILEDLERVGAELEGLVKSVADSAGEKAGDAADALKDRLGEARERLSRAERLARRNVKRGLGAADRYVRGNAWESLAAAAAIAFLAGFLMGRRD